MKEVRQMLLGILAALLTSAIVLGSLSLALLETARPLAQALATEAPLPPEPATLAPGAPTYTPTSTALPSVTLTPSCPIPPGWVTYMIRDDDTLVSLAGRYGLTPEDLKSKNCLLVNSLIPGINLSVPASTATPTATSTPTSTNTPRPTRTSIPCVTGRPGWVLYTIRSGDTLTNISRRVGVSVALLAQVNCIPRTEINLIHGGKTLWVPFLPPTFTPTRTALPSPTQPASTRTPTSIPPSHTPRPSSTAQGSPTPTATQPVPDTPTPTNPPSTSTPTNPPPPPPPTHTPTDVPTPTSTPATEPQPPRFSNPLAAAPASSSLQTWGAVFSLPAGRGWIFSPNLAAILHLFP